MRPKTNYLYILLALLFFSLVSAQTNRLKKAEKDYHDFAYFDAIVSYQELIAKGWSDQNIFERLGDANYYNANYSLAAKWYSKLFELEDATINAEYYFRHAQSLKSLKKYKESDFWMNKFEALNIDDRRAKKFVENKDYLTQIKKLSGKYDIKLAKFNSKVSDFAPTIYGDSVVFSSARDTGIVSRNIHEWNKGAFLDLYQASSMVEDSIFKVSQFSKNLNARTHESSTVFTKDGKTIYFTRNNSVNGRKFSKDENGISHLKIMRAELIDGKWDNIIELPFNDDTYSVAHPTLNPAEDKLYFSSNMDSSIGASDIYYVDINTDGTFGNPVNIGAKINTEARETFPFISSDNVLYFASDGLPGLGGLDIFAVDLSNLEHSKIINLGEPLNSVEDDFSIVLNQDNSSGFFASNRPGGVGLDDIYQLKVKEPLNFNCKKTIQGVVKDADSGKPLNLVKITGQNLAIETDELGQFNLEIECNKNEPTITASMKSYQSKTHKINTDSLNEILLQRELEIMESIAKESIVLPIIYFDFDAFEIRSDAQRNLNELYNTLVANPTVKLYIKSFTDSRGNTDYNTALSNKRAEATKEYLINLGVNPNRLQVKGFGEAFLTNKCDDLNVCPKQMHELNRRSEFEIISQ